MLALFPSRSVSQEQVWSHKPETVGFPCTETETFESHSPPPGVRDLRAERTVSQKGSVVLPREAQEPKSPSSLPESSILLSQLSLKGGPQKCSAHVKVCVCALSF